MLEQKACRTKQVLATCLSKCVVFVEHALPLHYCTFVPFQCKAIPKPFFKALLQSPFAGPLSRLLVFQEQCIPCIHNQFLGCIFLLGLWEQHFYQLPVALACS